MKRSSPVLQIGAITLLALCIAPSAVRADPPTLGTWDLAGDFSGATPYAQGIGPEGVWSYGDDVGESGNLTGFAAYNQFSAGQWTFAGDPFPPGASTGVYPGTSDPSPTFYSHEANHVTRGCVVVWTAPRDMTIAFSVAAWAPGDQGYRDHDIAWRCYDTDGATQLAGSGPGRIGGGSGATTYATRWRQAQSFSMRAQQTLSFWHFRRAVDGYVGVEFKVTEIRSASVLTDLGTLGGTYSYPNAINASGQVVGRSGMTGSAEQHAFLYSDGAMTDLTLGGSYGEATAINDSGQVVGYAYTTGDAAMHAFVYSDGRMTDLGTLGGSYSDATAINASGQVVGISNTTGNAEQHAFLYSDGTMLDLGTLGGSWSRAAAVNASGQVVGYAATLGNAESHAFLYSDGLMLDLGTLGGSYSNATAINASGQVVGWAGTLGNAESHAFLYSDGTMLDLGTLGGSWSRAVAVNRSGQVAGYSETVDGEIHAFLYSDGIMLDLGTLGGSYSEATALNDSAQVVGWSQIVYDAPPHAFAYANGEMIDLGTLGGGISGAVAINDAGQVAGWASRGFGMSSHAFLTTLRDVTAPAVTCPADVTVEATSPSGAAVTFSAATAVDARDGTVLTVSDHASGSTFPLGTTTVTCSATDVAGNVGTCSFTVTVVDTTAPTLAAQTFVLEADTPLDFAVEAQDAATASPEIEWVSQPGYGTLTPRAGSSGTAWTFTPSLHFVGVVTASVRARDGAGLVSSAATFTFDVRDTVAPSIACPSSVTAEATSASGAAVTFASPTATDAVDPAVSIALDRASGSTFSLGTTTVHAVATDDSGNSAACEFTVTVVDTTAPTLSDCRTTAIVVEAASAAGRVVTFSSPTAADAVDGSVAVVCSPASGSTFALGTTTVTCTATDAAGNSSSCSFSVIVEDSTAPSLACPSDVTIPATSSAGATVTFSATVADAVDVAPAVTFSPASGSMFAIGTTTVTCTATDDAGNASSCTFQVTVEGGASESAALADALAALPSSGSATTDAAIASAIVALDASADPTLWIDGTHVTGTGGKTVFSNQESAIKTLSKITNPDPVVTQVILATVALDQLLAQTAISDATARGGDAKTIAKAQKSLDAGRAAEAAGDYFKAANDYEAAWKTAIGA